jgi:hypothetical protein
MKERPLPHPRRYLGYTIRAYAVGIRWSVDGEFDPPSGRTSAVGVGDIRTLAEAKAKVREYEREFGKANGRKPSE